MRTTIFRDSPNANSRPLKFPDSRDKPREKLDLNMIKKSQSSSALAQMKVNLPSIAGGRTGIAGKF
jgi:hypothetical protein